MREIYMFDMRFIDANIHEIYDEIDKGGYMVAPSAPSLALLNKDEHYRESMSNCSLAIFDSAFLCLSLLFLKKINVEKVSGLKFIKFFLHQTKSYPEDSLFLINPTPEDSEANRLLINSYGYELKESHQYVAPIYPSGAISDPELLEVLEKLKPRRILINLGGGVQERLADLISSNVKFHTSIFCTGAAIAFLTGRQAKIPTLIDKLHLGWLVRCIFKPKVYIPRYLTGFEVFRMLINQKITVINK